VFYRDNAADMELTIDDVLAAPLGETGVFQFAGTNLSREPSRSATLFAAERSKEAGARVVLDLDFRPDQWHDARAFGVAIRSALRLTDVVLGTVDEVNAAVLADPDQVRLDHSQVSDARVAGDVEAAVARLLELGSGDVVEKRGEEGARIWTQAGETIDVPGFEVEIQNIVGAGDAFAAGFLYGYVNDWGWYRAGRLGNACGAIVVTKHGCANFMPTLAEATALADSQGGL
jgi:5-dehydro-2-deoxygluconokinase